MATVETLLAAARRRLADSELTLPRREAALLLRRVLGLSEAQLVARSREPVPASAGARFQALLERRLRGEPVAYLFGEREFWGRPFTVDRRVLVPRPESEHLVEAALALPLAPSPRLLDVGTGSGCLAITLALELAGARAVGLDASPAALAVAAVNVRRHRAGARVALAASDLTAAVTPGGFDLVVANLPYIDPRDASRLSPDVRDFEPEAALFAAEAGMAAIARLLAEATALAPGAWLLLEIGDHQLPELDRRLAESALERVAVESDYAGTPRVVVLRRR